MQYSIQGITESIKAARKKRGMSQRTLSSKTGIQQSHISKIEKGLIDLQISSLIEIARALDLELVLVSRSNLSAIQAINSLSSETSKSIPAYQLPNEEEDND